MMEYNSQRDKLKISEYGRNVQKLVEIAKTIEDRDERTKFAKLLVQIMGQMNPQIRDSGDFRHKLWDHLHIIANFELDVDSSYSLPSRDVLEKKPHQLSYGKTKIRYKMYGGNIVRIIDKAKDFPEGEERDALIHAIANHLKKSYLSWNRESVDDEQIFEHLETLSTGSLKLKDELKLNTTNEILSRNKKRVVTSTRPVKHHLKKRKKRI